MFLMVAEPCQADEHILAGLRGIYGSEAEVFAATFRLFRANGDDMKRPDAYLILCVPADEIPPELSPLAQITVIVDPRRAEAYYSLIVRGVESMPDVRRRAMRILPLSDRHAPQADANLIELPSCPVCFERLDPSATGLGLLPTDLKLREWPNISCPVCSIVASEEAVKQTRCMRCNTARSPWVCLLCGFVGCGRYVHFHAHRHFQESAHRFSVDVESMRIWDYVGDKYVHQLQPLKNGVETSQGAPGGPPVGKVVVTEEEDRDLLAATYASKLDAVVGEHKQLLDKQIESQKMYYEEQIRNLVERQNLDEKTSKQELESIQVKRNAVELQTQDLERELRQLSRRLKDVEKTLKSSEEDYDFYHSLNEGILRDKGNWKTHLEDAKVKLQLKQDEAERLSVEVEDLFKRIG